MSDDYERVKKWCKDPRGFDAAPYNSICRVFEDYDRLRAELADMAVALENTVRLRDKYEAELVAPVANVPEGFVLVPVEPTKEMLKSVAWLLQDNPANTASFVWTAMLAAAQAKGEG